MCRLIVRGCSPPSLSEPDSSLGGILLPTVYYAIEEKNEEAFVKPEPRAGTIVAIGPGRLLYQVLHTWAANVREQVRANQQAWVRNLMADELPKLIEEGLQRGLREESERRVAAEAAAAERRAATNGAARCNAAARRWRASKPCVL